jgi:hypothetical protein
MGKFVLLVALLVASAGALNDPDPSGRQRDDEAVFEIQGQQVFGHHHPTEDGQVIVIDNFDAPRPAHEQGPPFTDHPKPGEPWHPGPKFTNLTIYEALCADEQ